MNDLTHTISHLLEPIRDLHARLSAAAPNSWEQYMNKLDTDRGTELEYDYEVYDHGDTTVIYPVAKAAQEWCAAHLPANSERWGRHGYVIRTDSADLVLSGMKRDGLVSENEYVNLCELEQQMQDQANQDFAEYQGEDR